MPKNCEDIIFTLQCDDDNVILKYIHKVIVIVFHSSKQQYNIIIIRKDYPGCEKHNLFL